MNAKCTMETANINARTPKGVTNAPVKMATDWQMTDTLAQVNATGLIFS